MNVLHFCWEYPPRGSGVGKYIHEISAGLRILGHQSIVVTSRGDGLPEKDVLDCGCVYRIYDNRDIGERWVSARVLEIARHHRVDLIEAVDRLGEAAEVLKTRARPPVLINCRYNDVVYRARYAQAWYPWQKWAIDMACVREWRRMRRERFSIENADLLAAPSRWMLESLRHQGVRLPERAAVLPKPLAPIPGWVNAEAPTPVLLLVGRVDVGKGVAYLHDILARIAMTFPDVCLEIAGEDSYARFIGSTRAWAERRLGDQRHRVRFLGNLDRVALDEAYRRAWVVIIPSRWDTSPTVLLEAMARAKASVVSPFGGMAEYLADERWVADPAAPGFADAIAQLLADPSLRATVGAAGRTRLESCYTPEMAAKHYVGFVEGVLRDSNR